MGFQSRRISPSSGAEMTGIDLREPLDNNQFAAIRQAWNDADGLLVIRDQNISPEQHIAFSRRFGVLQRGEVSQGSLLSQYYLPRHPEIYRVSNKKKDGVPQGREDAGTYWHSDGSWKPAPPMASLLLAREIPPYGGDTMFADLYRAYETLSDRMKDILTPMRAVHSLAKAQETTSYGKDLVGQSNAVVDRYASHPIIRTHPETGRKSLFVNRGFTDNIEGLAPAESDAFLEFLFTHSSRPEILYRHQWRLHDLVIWDNRCTMHYAVADYKQAGDRYMHRTTVRGDAPF
ncbi:MAG: TauD/TfdA family dioxygenase [Acetobacteraceae bacterium]|nr:TauD/TfdA family dioxygenase [Acetobacteraceae bacterium]